MAELIARKGRRYEELAAAGEMLYPGAADFIRAAAARVPDCHRLGRAHPRDRGDPRADRPAPLFPVIVGADQTARSKPHPEPYLTAFARLKAHTGRGLEPWRSVAIEDSKWGLVSARGADLRLVAVTNTYPRGGVARGGGARVRAGSADLTLERLDALVSD